MSAFLKVTKLSLILLSLVVLLIVLPAVFFDVLICWQVPVLALSYLCFFLTTIWRTLKYGELAQRNEDEQVKSKSGILAFAISIVGIISVHWLAFWDFSYWQNIDRSPAALVLNLIAIVLICSSILINQSAILTLGKFFDRLTIKSEHQLVTTGIYSFVRHPIYLSYILLFAGFCLILQSKLAILMLIFVCLVWFGQRISIEEEMLQKEFGEKYQTYRQQTKKLVPFIY